MAAKSSSPTATTRIRRNALRRWSSRSGSTLSAGAERGAGREVGRGAVSDGVSGWVSVSGIGTNLPVRRAAR